MRLVIMFVLAVVIGTIVWMIVSGIHMSPRPGRYKENDRIPPEYDRPGRAAANRPEDDAAFLSQLRARAEAQRKAAAERARLLRQQEDEPPKS